MQERSKKIISILIIALIWLYAFSLLYIVFAKLRLLSR